MVGQIAKQQEEGHFFKAKAPFFMYVLHQIGDVVAAVGEDAVIWHLVAFVQHITVHVTNGGQPCHHAGAIGVTQPFFDVGVVKILGRDAGIILIIFTYGCKESMIHRRIIRHREHLLKSFRVILDSNLYYTFPKPVRQ